MSVFNEYNENIGILFADPPPPPPTSQFLPGAGGDDEETTPYKGLSLSELAKMYKDGRLPEQDYRAELTARKTGVKAIEELVNQNKPLTQKNGSLTGLAESIVEKSATAIDKAERNATSLKSLSETDILNRVKSGAMTADEAEKALVRDKGYSPLAAKITLEKYRGAAQTPEQAASSRALEARGITSKLSEADIVKGAKNKLWSPDEAYEALVNLKGYSPAEATTYLRLQGWRAPGDGPASMGPAQGQADLRARFNTADTPGGLMAMSMANQQAQQNSGGFSIPGSASSGSRGLSSVSGVINPGIIRPQMLTPGGGSSPSSASGGGKVMAEDGSMVPASFYNNTNYTPVARTSQAPSASPAAAGYSLTSRYENRPGEKALVVQDDDGSWVSPATWAGRHGVPLQNVRTDNGRVMVMGSGGAGLASVR